MNTDIYQEDGAWYLYDKNSLRCYGPFGLNPLIEKNGLWYFSDETWTKTLGPYTSKEIAIQQLIQYCDRLNFGIVS